MMKVSVDDQVAPISLDADTKLSDVLDQVVAALPPNRLVTKVTTDDDGVSVRTVDKEIWAATGLDISLSCIERVQRSLIHAADLFRAEDRGTANHFFVHCVDGLERFLESMFITRCALKLDFNQISVDGISLTQLEKDFGKILENIILFQEKQDFAAIADKVEYELLTNLSAWTAALRQLRLNQASNA